MARRRWVSVALSVLMTVMLFGVVAEAETVGGPAGGPVVAAETAPLIRPAVPGRVESALTMKVEGGRQGNMLGNGQDGSINLLGFSHAVSVNRELGPGRASGRREHSPLVVTKEVDHTSPQLMQALVTNENLRTVKLTVSGTAGSPLGGKAQPQPLYTITLTNVQIADIAQSGGADGLPVESISFSYESIAWTWLAPHYEATDSLREQR